MPRRILIAGNLIEEGLLVDNEGKGPHTISDLLKDAYYDILTTPRFDSLNELAMSKKPDLIIVYRPENQLQFSTIFNRLKQHPKTKHIPILTVLRQAETAAVLDFLNLGADSVLSEPLHGPFILAKIRSILKGKSIHDDLHLDETHLQDLILTDADADAPLQAHIAMAVGSAQTAKYWHQALCANCAATVQHLPKHDPLSALSPEKLPDLFVLSSSISQTGDGLEILAKLRSNPETRDQAVLMVFPSTCVKGATLALELGANDVMRAERPPQEVALRALLQVQNLQKGNQRRAQILDGLRHANKDPLTGLHNRRYANFRLSQLAELSKKNGQPFAVMILDLDNFKSINDRFGHPTGDQILKEVARQLKRAVRPTDLLARVGGEEFLVALENCGFENADATAERLRHIIDVAQFAPDATACDVNISVSIGATVSEDKGAEIPTMLELADGALYVAKSSGRNQVAFSHLPGTLLADNPTRSTCS